LIESHFPPIHAIDPVCIYHWALPSQVSWFAGRNVSPAGIQDKFRNSSLVGSFVALPASTTFSNLSHFSASR
jgi:hypothetical protein